MRAVRCLAKHPRSCAIECLGFVVLFCAIGNGDPGICPSLQLIEFSRICRCQLERDSVTSLDMVDGDEDGEEIKCTRLCSALYIRCWKRISGVNLGNFI